jgi:hypothetical protein
MILLTINIQDLFVNFVAERLIDFSFRLIENCFFTFILLRFIYYPKNNQLEHLFTFFQMGLIVFFIASILENIKLEFGFALGLFAVFSIIRFRTPPIELKEMAYFFTVIGLSIINALVEYQISDWIGLLICNLIIIGSAYIFDGYKPRKLAMKKTLTFKPSGLHILTSNTLLLEEIKKRTSINVTKAEITKINSVKGEISVWIYFKMLD